MTTSKEAFLHAVSPDYGYGGAIDGIRAKEYARLEGKCTVYLDHTGTTLYPASTVDAFARNLQEHIYGNPHSRHPSSTLTDGLVDETRLKVLAMCRADPSEYGVVFTANATAALKLCWEMCPLDAASASEFYYLRESHTSVVGLRALADSMKIAAHAIDADDVPAILATKPPPPVDGGEAAMAPSYSLFVYPAQCNYSGRRFPWTWPSLARHRQWLVAVDASAYAATSPIDLSNADAAPDFVALSFYKLFGFPTGLGALIVRKSRMPLLRKAYFGGGTGQLSSVMANTHWQMFRDTLHTRYEDGTVNFLDIIGLGIAIDEHRRIYGSMQAVAAHTHALYQWLYEQMHNLTHENGQHVCRLYIDHEMAHDPAQQGPVITFNLMRADGSPVGYAEVEAIASVNRIHLRTGGFCNPGAAQKWLQLTDADVRRHAEAGHVCWDDQDIIDGQLTGAVRLSLGAMSSYEDVAAWLTFLRQYYVEGMESAHRPAFFTTYRPKLHGPTDNITTAATSVHLSRLTIFPIKSCHGYSIPADTDWPVTAQGLLYDREWMLVRKDTERALTQKQYPILATIRPSISMARQELVVNAPGMDELRLPLQTLAEPSQRTDVRVCGEV
ncbi:pyridoxal phosphate-dependent transferase [Syncephalis pseudoplumigaleata]|uniref:Pyridoxal phosphate-dependent transferase n=1 Tax=Syncephalis pseudoplumigaleata TaxID=1712513 RepID=A0A4P9YXA7_9FUNG|nr:pyridoxal phosphate-dependent transferase [Syncephalis pseudoplumigaleata]|eukprot:RKP24677.1 pyridoxal phosphate-dependent transferase [Syncephalis pseudoplumigaleata]